MWWNLRHYVHGPLEQNNTTFRHSIREILDCIWNMSHLWTPQMNVGPGHEGCEHRFHELRGSCCGAHQFPYVPLGHTRTQHLQKQAAKYGTTALDSKGIFELRDMPL